MAKKWSPSLNQLSAYDELLKRQNQTRKVLLKRRRLYEEEGVGRSLPDLVLPMKARRFGDVSRYRFDSFQDYREKMRALTELYGGSGSPVLQYYKKAYKRNILNIVRDWIDAYIGLPDKPEGKFGKYSEDQIDLANRIANDGGKYLDLYNKLISLRTTEFMDMYDSGMIPPLKIIYDEMKDNINLSKVDEFLDMFSQYRKEIRENNPNRMVTRSEERYQEIKSTGKRRR